MMNPYEKYLVGKIEKDPRVMVLTAENRALIRNLPEKLGPAFVDTGITEQCMVGTAAGLALRGRVPIAHALATFLTMRAFEFIRTDVGIPNLPVKLVGFVPGLLSDGNGPTHQAIEDVSLMRGIPGMKVFCPADDQEFMDAIDTIIEDPSPWYIRYNQRAAVTKHQPFRIGQAEFLSQGSDIALLTYGTLFQECWEAKQSLEKSGLSVSLVNLRTLKPIDEDALLKAAESHRLVVTIEDHFQTGGLASILSEVLLKNRTTCSHFPIAFKERWYQPATFARVLEHEELTGPQLANRISKHFKESL